MSYRSGDLVEFTTDNGGRVKTVVGILYRVCQKSDPWPENIWYDWWVYTSEGLMSTRLIRMKRISP
jgi:hypothetical protein